MTNTTVFDLSNIYSYGHFSYKMHSERRGYDTSINTLKCDVVSRTVNLKNPKIAEKLIILALEHFGDDFSAWVNDNIKRNPYISENSVKVIHDFTNFIKTGRLTSGVNAWSWTMKPSRNDRRGITSDRKVYEYSSTGLPIFTTEILKKIISNNEEGIFQLLDIMNLLFGRSHALTDTVSVKIDY